MTQCHDYYETDPVVTAQMPLLVRDLMTKQTVTVEPTATIKEIAHILLTKDVRSVPVVDTGDLMVGLVGEADVICRECPDVRRHTLGALVDRAFGHHEGWTDKAEGVTAGEIMSKEVLSCSPTEPIAVAARRMLANNVRMLPVLNDGVLIGVLSRRDVLRLFDRPDDEVRVRVGQLLASPLWAPAGHNVSAQVVDGTVKLSGQVRLPADAGMLVSLIKGVPGVIEVVDRMTAERSESIAPPAD